MWTAEERRLASVAWLRSTNDPIVGCDQKADEFVANIHTVLSQITPRGADPSMFAGRGAHTVYKHLRDKIFPDIQKFNKALNLVYSCNPTGTSPQQIINMAVVIHSGVTTRMDYRYIDYDANSWVNYQAWMVLKEAPKFRPPTRRTNANETNENEDDQTQLTNDPSLPSAAVPPPDRAAQRYLFDEGALSNQDANQAVLQEDVPSVVDFVAPARGTANGQRKAKREKGKKHANDEKVNELKKIRLSIEACAEEKRQMAIEKRQMFDIMKLRSVISICRGVDEAKVNQARQQLLKLTATAMTVPTAVNTPNTQTPTTWAAHHVIAAASSENPDIDEMYNDDDDDDDDDIYNMPSYKV